MFLTQRAETAHGNFAKFCSELIDGFVVGLWGRAGRCSGWRLRGVDLGAEESTGNLDKKTGEAISALFKKLAWEEADRTIVLEDGRIVWES